MSAELIAVAQDTLRVLQAGGYAAPSGRAVRLDRDTLRSANDTWLAAPDSPELHRAPPRPRRPLQITVSGESSGEAVHRVWPALRHVAVLNFANAITPGGGFLQGARAQEEQLCRMSTLYPSLTSDRAPARAFYGQQAAARDARALDLVRVTPGVVFFRDDAFQLLDNAARATVLTCAAPDLGSLRAQMAAGQVPGDALASVPAILARRARLIVQAAAAIGVDDLVLGAWGCGAFRNDPHVVARAFRDALADFPFFASVTFAIRRGGPPDNRVAFDAVLG